VPDGKESVFETALGEVVTLRLRSGQAAIRAEAGCVEGRIPRSIIANG
jgi:hypothetical protein